VFSFFPSFYKDGDSDRFFLYPILFLSKIEVSKFTSYLYKTAIIAISSLHTKISCSTNSTLVEQILAATISQVTPLHLYKYGESNRSFLYPILFLSIIETGLAHCFAPIRQNHRLFIQDGDNCHFFPSHKKCHQL
jgi:hypothetical protein